MKKTGLGARNLGPDSRSPPMLRCALCIVSKQKPIVTQFNLGELRKSGPWAVFCVSPSQESNVKS